MYANHVARGDGSTFSREKGRESAMTVSSGFKGSCDYCSKIRHKQAQCFKFLRESGRGPLPLRGAGRISWCGLYNTHLHDNDESPPSGIGFLFLAGSTATGPLKFAMTSDCGASSTFIGEIESRMKDTVKLDPPAMIVIAGHNTFKKVSMGILIVRVTDAQGFLHDMLLPAMNVPGLGRHLFSGGTAAMKGINTVIDKESYLDVGQFKIPLRNQEY